MFATVIGIANVQVTVKLLVPLPAPSAAKAVIAPIGIIVYLPVYIHQKSQIVKCVGHLLSILAIGINIQIIPAAIIRERNHILGGRPVGEFSVKVVKVKYRFNIFKIIAAKIIDNCPVIYDYLIEDLFVKTCL